MWYSFAIKGHRRIPRGVRLFVAGIAVLGWLTPTPTPALAADSIFWNWSTIQDNEVVGGGISVAALDGNGGHGFAVSGAPVDHPLGVAIDSATGTIYWANFGNGIDYCSGTLQGPDTIAYAKLDGTGGGTLNTSGATVLGPDGVTIDPAAGRLYWANEFGNRISYAMLDGSGGHDLNTTGATVDCPAGVVIDPAEGRVYWTNLDGNKISYANLDGSGGGDLPTGKATVSGPWGLAIDAAAGRVYWANNDGNTISYANLDGSGGQDLNTAGATVDGPWGVALDPGAGRIYWSNNLAASLSYASLDGSGGADLNTSGATSDHAKYAALLEAPGGVGAPVVTGGSVSGSTVSCSPGSWARDLPEAFLFRAPLRLAYAWSRNGIPMAATSSSIAVSSPGSYVCRVTASNYAGAAALTSAALTVVARPSGAIAVMSWRVWPGGAVGFGVRVPGSGTLYGVATFAQRRTITASRRALYGIASVIATKAGTRMLVIRPTRAASRLMAAGKRLRLTLTLAFIGPDGAITRTGATITVGAP